MGDEYCRIARIAAFIQTPRKVPRAVIAQSWSGAPATLALSSSKAFTELTKTSWSRDRKLHLRNVIFMDIGIENKGFPLGIILHLAALLMRGCGVGS